MVDRKQLLALMDEAEAVYLATISGKGPRIRALVNLRRADKYPGASKTARTDDFTVYLATSAASDKVQDMQANPAVALYYCKPEHYQGAMLSGRAEILDDPKLKKALWSPDWRVFWPREAADPDYVVVRIKTDEISGWWQGQPLQIEGK